MTSVPPADSPDPAQPDDDGPVRLHGEMTGHDDVKRVMTALYPDVSTTTDGDGNVTGTATFAPVQEHTGAPGWVQGGLSATVLDYVAACTAHIALDSLVATGTLDLRYRQPVLIDNGPYEVVATCSAAHSRTVRVRAAILSAESRPLVEADGLFIAVTKDGTNPTPAAEV